MSNILAFPAGGRRDTLSNPSFTYARSRKNMHTLVFRSRTLILEVDEATLLADVRFDLEKAERKLAHHRAYLQSFTEQAQKKVQELATVIAKLGAAVEAARRMEG
ncbi:hypothetical protein ACNJX9_17865 [Bradyrhizobium sp. DASA03076]|uniref:hypothetical protein n=1 Tax=Bradyrhizobium sp. BLXBL-03 TaxID=3395916 RepID=UPI003F6F692C